MKKDRDLRERRMRARRAAAQVENFADYGEGEEQYEEEEEEDPRTLEEADYDRFFPILSDKKLKKTEGVNDEMCSICIDKIINEGREKVRRIDFCSHLFHAHCLKDWLQVNESCPNCKLELNKDNLILLEELKRKEKEKNKFNNKKINLKGDKKPKRTGDRNSNTLNRIEPITVNVVSVNRIAERRRESRARENLGDRDNERSDASLMRPANLNQRRTSRRGSRRRNNERHSFVRPGSRNERNVIDPVDNQGFQEEVNQDALSMFVIQEGR